MNKPIDDPENPEWTAADRAAARRGIAHLPRPMQTAIRQVRRGRGPQRAPTKEQVTLRLSPDVLAAFRQTGRGWQGRIDAVLRKTVRRSSIDHLAEVPPSGPVTASRHRADGRGVRVARKAAKKR